MSICVFYYESGHLELASDLSSVTFLSALQRFIAWHGRASDLYDDYATNFVGASTDPKLMQTAAEQEMITFKFSPPSDPHFNGLAEAGMKSVKLHLMKVVGEQIITYEEFYTVLTLIESILNSRPFTPFSSDVEDIKALTPTHFLTLEPVGALSVPDYTSVASTRLSRFELIQRIQTDC
ncbi:hypothetical protein JTB14_003393 [Gonioctena quinquepunctata]|nr:hypothetical protein JTB14_003393 [Gonioctena quinquepunctata]